MLAPGGEFPVSSSCAHIVRMEYIYGLQSKKISAYYIYDWNYWWGYYRCGKDWEPFHAAEFSLSEDEAGKAPFFHFDFHNLPALHQTILDGEFVEPDNPEHPHFLEQARRLRSGEQDWFVGALYYPLFSPEMHFCNASVRSGVPLTQLLSPSVPPYYGVIFLREERPLTPEVLTRWVETLSRPLFGQPFSCTLAQVPSRQEAMEQFENEMRPSDEMHDTAYP